jgi:hypothetical protein
MKKLALEALQEIRIKYRWPAIDQENEAIEKAKLSKKRFEPKLLANDDTVKQLLARSRYFYYKNKSKWSKNPNRTSRVII